MRGERRGRKVGTERTIFPPPHTHTYLYKAAGATSGPLAPAASVGLVPCAHENLLTATRIATLRQPVIDTHVLLQQSSTILQGENQSQHRETDRQTRLTSLGAFASGPEILFRNRLVTEVPHSCMKHPMKVTWSNCSWDSMWLCQHSLQHRCPHHRPSRSEGSFVWIQIEHMVLLLRARGSLASSLGSRGGQGGDGFIAPLGPSPVSKRKLLMALMKALTNGIFRQ